MSAPRNRPESRSPKSQHYRSTQCPECKRKKIKIIAVTKDYHRVAVHGKRNQPFVECPGSGARIVT